MQRKTKRVLVLLLFVIATLAFVMSGASPADCSTSYPGGTSGGNYGGDGEIADSGKTEDSGNGEYYCRHEKAAWETTQEATCTENGREEYWCYNCGRMIDYRTIKQLGHNYSEWQIVTPATDSEDGLKVRYCDRCKDEETQIIPKTTHTHSFTETVVEPTCTERGYTLHQCTCGEHYEDSFKSALDHSFTNYISDGNATCTQDGTKTAKCDRCNETNTITDIGSRTGHTFDKQVATEKYLNSAATCTAKATYFYSCKCGEKGTATFEYGNTLGHNYGEWRVVSPATEETTGLKERTCLRCNNKETQIIPKTTHTHSFTETVVEPTCTERGYTLHQCTCGEHYEDSFKSALDHNFTNYISDGNATCTQDGTKTAKCVRCDETNTITDIGSKTGHTFDKQVATEKYLNSAATCTAKATYFYSCKCGEKGTATFEYGNALGHDYGEWRVVSPATEETTGLKERTCLRCNDKETQIIPKTTHTHSFTETVVEPTCTEKGYTLHQCTCGEHYEDSFKSALDHNFTNYISDGNATCTQDGTKTAKCDRCNETNTITDVGSKTGHTFDKQVATEKYLNSAATCTAKATYFYSCKCGEKGTATFEYGNALGHDYVNGVCSRCGDELMPTNGLEYTLNSDGKCYSCTGIGTATDTDIIIASVYNGLPVTSIGDFAFEKCNKLKNVLIGNNVTSISYSAFKECRGLRNIIIPNSVSTILSGAFYDCIELTSVTIGNKVTTIGGTVFNNCYKLVEVINNSSLNITKGSSDYGGIGECALNVKKGGSSEIVNKEGYLFYTYNDVNYLLGYSGTETELTLPQNYNGQTYEIYKFAFAYCSGLTSITISDSVTSIGDFAFRDCEALTSVTIPDSVTSIGRSAFAYCSGLTSIIIPDSVTSIEKSAFGNCSRLENVTIGKNVTNIDDFAFGNCSKLSSLIISLSITKIDIDSESFYNCNLLTNIYITDLSNWCKIDGLYPLMSCESTNKKLYLNDKLVTDLVIPNNVTSIGSGAFTFCSELNKIVIPNSVTNIGNYTFKQCIGLSSVSIGSNIVAIGDEAFYNCKKLTNIVIPNSVTTIGYRAFTYCSGLTSVTIGSKVVSIGDYAFDECYKLVEVINNSALEITEGSSNYGKIENYALIVKKGGNSDIINKNGYLFYTRPSYGNYLIGYTGSQTELTLPNSYNDQNYKIYDYAFAYCKEVTSIIIPECVTEIGHSAFKYCTNLISVLIPKSITSISSYAFQGCRRLTKIIIPDSVTSIVGSAFAGCISLTSITVGNSVTYIGSSAFSGCIKLIEIINNSKLDIQKGSGEYGGIGKYALKIKTSGYSDIVNKNGYLFYTYEGVNYLLGYTGTQTVLTLPDNYNGQKYEIYENAFLNCSGLTSITIPNSVTSIGWSAFYNCSGLTSVTIGNSVASIGYSAFEGCSGLTSVTIGNSVTSIGDRAFYNCRRLEIIYYTGNVASWCEINGLNYLMEHGLYNKKLYLSNQLVAGELIIPDGVKFIGNSAFDGCSGLTSITIPDSVTSIGSNAFAYCSGLTSVTIGNSITSIGERAFYYCSGLTSITIPDSVTSIGSHAFYDCRGLTRVIIPNNVTSIGNSAFDGCSGLTSVTIGNSVTSIGNYAFSGCRGLTSVTIGNGVTSIGSNAFYNCRGLTRVIIPNNVTSIGNSAFAYCSGLTSVTIPDSVTSIGSNAFYYCSGLTTIEFKGTIAQWNAVNKGSSWKIGIPSMCTVKCTDGIISI